MIRKIILSSFLLSLSACPRGETNTLEQVLNDAQKRFEKFSVEQTQVPADVKQTLDLVSKDLKAFISSADTEKPAQAIALANKIDDMISNASFTVRPALTEVSKQLRELSLENKLAVTDLEARAKLLASRAYSALAGELQTTGFKNKS